VIADRRVRIALLVVAAAYGWWMTSLPSFSNIGLFAVLLIGVAVIALGARVRAARPAGGVHTPGERHARIAVWSGLVAAIGVWELVALFNHPRHDHPTISSITDPMQQYHAVRWLFFGAWLALGWALAT